MSHLWIGLFCFLPTANWSAGRKIVWIPWNLSFRSLMAKNKLCEREEGWLFRIFCWQMKINKFLLKYYFYLFFGNNLNCYWVLLFKNHLFYQSLVKTRKILFWTDEISFQGNQKVFFVVDGFVRFFLNLFVEIQHLNDWCESKEIFIDEQIEQFFFNCADICFMNIWSILQRL